MTDNMDNRYTPVGVTVYCGAANGNSPEFINTAAEIGRNIAAAGVPLIYGGGHMGMMGAVGKAVRSNGGKTISVIPEFMVQRGWNDPEASETITTSDMSDRKKILAALARGIIALPGGIGTIDELTEIITLRQLGIFPGNIVLLDTLGYYAPFVNMINNAVSNGFLPAGHCSLFNITADPAEAVSLALSEWHELNLQAKF